MIVERPVASPHVPLPELSTVSGAWKITTSHLTFMCSNLGKPNKQYSIKQLMGWGVIPTAAAYIPTSAGGNKSGGQIKQLGTMLLAQYQYHIMNSLST